MRSSIVFYASLILAVLISSECFAQTRTLRVVVYPFIPNYKSVLYYVKTTFEEAHPEIRLSIIDLHSNYYSSTSADYIGTSTADVYELDSVFLADFVKEGKIQALPSAIKLSQDEVLAVAWKASQIESVRYGFPHWVCGNFLFFHTDDKALSQVKSLSDLEAAIGPIGKGGGPRLMTDLKGKSTLGEFYLETAFDHYGNWTAVLPHLSSLDPILQSDLIRLRSLCDADYCRSQDYHENKPEIYGRQFARGRARALIGYSETLNAVLNETNESCSIDEKCLTDDKIGVLELGTDDAGLHQVAWVDSFSVDTKCTGQCAKDAISFISFMDSDDTYKYILLHAGASPAYLLPAKKSLYNDADVLKDAHLYPQLEEIIQKAEVPSTEGLNETLRKIGKDLDSKLP